MAVLIIKPPALVGSTIIDPLSLTVFSFDVTTNEDHAHSTEWTEFPVETGLDISDHAVDVADEVTITGIISDTPVYGVPAPDRAKQAYETLLRLRSAHRLVTVVTGLRVYNSMGITSVSTSRDAETGQSVMPTVTFKQISLVQSVTIPIPAALLKPQVVAGGQSPVDAGAQAPESKPAAVEPADQDTTAYGSWLQKGYDAVL
jgi:hypothetical protein